jgi:hypothetical protein
MSTEELSGDMITGRWAHRVIPAVPARHHVTYSGCDRINHAKACRGVLAECLCGEAFHLDGGHSAEDLLRFSNDHQGKVGPPGASA